MYKYQDHTQEVVHMTFLPYIFSRQVTFGACYITSQWGRVQNKIKNALMYFQELFWAVFFFFLIKFVPKLSFFEKTAFKKTF